MGHRAIQIKGPGLGERKERRRVPVSLKLVAKNVAWHLALPQTGVQNNCALEGSVSLPGGAQENQEAACCREIPRTRKDGKKNKQANTKCPIYFPAQSLWESWRVDSGNNRVSGRGARGVGGGSFHLPSGPREAAMSQDHSP